MKTEQQKSKTAEHQPGSMFRCFAVLMFCFFFSAFSAANLR
ncbi:MAG: hypothetical protein ACYC26_14715 [Phycisphaerales bacterium]